MRKEVFMLPELGGIFPCKLCASNEKRESIGEKKKKKKVEASLAGNSGHVSRLDLTPQTAIKISPRSHHSACSLGSRQQGSESLLILLHVGQPLRPPRICSAPQACLLPSLLPEPHLCEICDGKRAAPPFPTPLITEHVTILHSLLYRRIAVAALAQIIQSK